MDRLRGNQDRLLVCTDGPKAYLWKSINALFFSSYLNLLMLCTPFAVLARQHGSDGVIFAFSLLAIAPFAERLSFVTEQLALHTNETRHSRGTRGCLATDGLLGLARLARAGAPRSVAAVRTPQSPDVRHGDGGAPQAHVQWL